MDFQQLAILLLPLLAGALLDALIGDPAWLPHPVVGMGKLIGGAEKALNRGARRMLKGALTAIILIGATYALFWWFIPFCYGVNQWLGVGVSAIFIFYFLFIRKSITIIFVLFFILFFR